MQQPPSWSGAAAVGSRSTPPRAMTRTAAALMGDMGGHTQGEEIDYRTKVVKEIVQTEQHYVTMLKRLVSVSSPSPLLSPSTSPCLYDFPIPKHFCFPASSSIPQTM